MVVASSGPRLPKKKYIPKVDDYVKWRDHEGWIYWIDKENTYLTIEIMVRKKSDQSYKDCNLHRNERCLVCCYPENWKELEYIRNRSDSVVSEEVNSMDTYKSQKYRYSDPQ